MKKINILLILTLIFSFLQVQPASAKWFNFFNKNKTESQVEQQVKTDDLKIENQDLKTESEEYKFPLDNNAGPFDISKETIDSIQPENVLEAQVTKEHETPDKFGKDIQLMSDTVDFYTETRQYVAKGDAKLLIPKEKMEMYANEIVLDHKNYEIIGVGNVRILKDGMEYFGDYIRINTKKESSFFTEPILYYTDITIDANSATMYADETIAKDGTALIKKNKSTIVSTSNFGQIFPERFFNIEKEFDTDKDKYKVVAKKIEVKRIDDRTDILLRNATIYRGKHKVGYSPVFTVSADKDVNYIETIVPEMGNKPRIGTYIAPAIVLGLPNASALKVGPLLAMNGSDFGVGAFARLSTPKSKTELAYASSTGNFLANMSYRFTDNVSLNFVGNEYLDNAWMGGQLPNYGLELAYDRRNIRIKEANLVLRNKLSAGFFDDNRDYGSDLHKTIRYQWLVDGFNEKPLLAWEKYLMLGYSYQHAFSLYQTGQTTGVVRAGPRIYTDLGRLSAELTYFIGGQYGESPFVFDRYRYGRNNIRLRAQYYVNKYLSIAYHGSANIGDKDYEGEWLTENQLLVAVGTEDLKVRIGFDTVRNSTLVGLDMLLGSNKTLLEFDEMKIKDSDTHVSKKKKDNKTETTENQQEQPKI
ncbi:MAG: hypothetical protein MJ180_02660 [Candidatus Gastranaerophilales bacterium]|nr:hypothetical protein [Candidatus Gastranaerophilales bacterium]